MADNSHNHTTLTGITSLSFAADGTDTASITTTISATDTFFDFNLSDDTGTNDRWRWRFTPSGNPVFSAMELIPITTSTAKLVVIGDVQATSFLGNATTASTLATARTIAISGAVTGTATSFNGSANISIPTTVDVGSTSIAGTLAYDHGGTGFSSYAKGDTIYASETNTLAKLPIGVAGKVMQVSDTGIPAWADIDGGTY